MNLRAGLLAAGVIVSVGTTGGTAMGQSMADQLTVASWGGSYTRSQVLAFVDPFRKQTGSWVEVVDFNGDLAEVREQVRSLNVTYGVVDLEGPELIQGCADGLL